MTSKTIIGNLKMNAVRSVLEAYRDQVSDQSFGLLVPYPYLGWAQDLLKDTSVWIGAQGLSEHAQGAYTSQVSGAMLKEIGVHQVLVGHQEVRALGVDAKAQFHQARLQGLKIIYCVGESAEEHARGDFSQLEAQLEVIDHGEDLIVAYEPIWSIGTGQVPEYSEIQAALNTIRAHLKSNIAGNIDSIQILYGGSIDNKNCEAVMSHTDVDGFLIGGASLKPEQMLEVVERCK